MTSRPPEMNQAEQPVGFWRDLKNDFHDIRTANAEEFKGASKSKKALLGVAVGSLACEWLTGTDIAIIAYVGGQALEGGNGIAYTAATVGLTATAIQIGFGMAAVPSVDRFPKTMEAARQKADKWRGGNKPKEAKPKGKIKQIVNHVGNAVPHETLSRFIKRGGKAFATGTTLSLLIENSQQQHTKRENAKNVMTDAALIGLGTVCVGAAVAGITELGKKYGMASEAEVVTDVISSPFTWIAAFLGVTYSKLRASHRERTAPKS